MLFRKLVYATKITTKAAQLNNYKKVKKKKKRVLIGLFIIAKAIILL